MTKTTPKKATWSVTRVGWKWMPVEQEEQEDAIELRGMAWDLTCPSGHRLRVYTRNFESIDGPLDVGCPRCNRAYPATFKSPPREPARGKGRIHLT